MYSIFCLLAFVSHAMTAHIGGVGFMQRTVYPNHQTVDDFGVKNRFKVDLANFETDGRLAPEMIEFLKQWTAANTDGSSSTATEPGVDMRVGELAGGHPKLFVPIYLNVHQQEGSSTRNHLQGPQPYSEDRHELPTVNDDADWLVPLSNTEDVETLLPVAAHVINDDKAGDEAVSHLDNEKEVTMPPKNPQELFKLVRKSVADERLKKMIELKRNRLRSRYQNLPASLTAAAATKVGQI